MPRPICDNEFDTPVVYGQRVGQAVRFGGPSLECLRWFLRRLYRYHLYIYFPAYEVQFENRD